jgi:hypothetical protein
MPCVLKVTGHTLIEHIGYMPADHTDYKIVVAFDRWEDNRETLENFVAWYWRVDLKANPSERYRVLTDENCALALVVFYFRDQHTRFHDANMAWSRDTPTEAPAVETKTYRLWITKKVSKEVFTALNAGWELYCRCEYGKLSVADAKDFVRDKFPGQHFLWDDVLRFFRKQGGRHTPKYLRRD